MGVRCGVGLFQTASSVDKSGADLILDESIYVVLGTMLRSGDFENVGDAEKRLLSLAVCHDLTKR